MHAGNLPGREGRGERESGASLGSKFHGQDSSTRGSLCHPTPPLTAHAAERAYIQNSRNSPTIPPHNSSIPAAHAPPGPYPKTRREHSVVPSLRPPRLPQHVAARPRAAATRGDAGPPHVPSRGPVARSGPPPESGVLMQKGWSVVQPGVQSLPRRAPHSAPTPPLTWHAEGRAYILNYRNSPTMPPHNSSTLGIVSPPIASPNARRTYGDCVCSRPPPLTPTTAKAHVARAHQRGLGLGVGFGGMAGTVVGAVSAGWPH